MRASRANMSHSCGLTLATPLKKSPRINERLDGAANHLLTNPPERHSTRHHEAAPKERDSKGFSDVTVRARTAQQRACRLPLPHHLQIKGLTGSNHRRIPAHRLLLLGKMMDSLPSGPMRDAR